MFGANWQAPYCIAPFLAYGGLGPIEVENIMAADPNTTKLLDVHEAAT